MREAQPILALFLVALIHAGDAYTQGIQTNGLYGGPIVSFATSPLAGAWGSETHLINNKEYRSKVESAFKEREQLARHRKDKLFSVFESGLSLQQEEALKFLFAYMPLNDLADYDGDFFLANANIALKTRKESPWGKSIPEDIFLHYVLPCRIHTEYLDSFRMAYDDEIHARVKGMDATEAALEINHWCHEKVAYQAISGMIIGPMGTMLSARGACGSLSIFTAAALRTAGIPARYVNTIFTHWDGDHAWVEVWIDGKWHYMEACAPEPVLDRAWFTEDASRAMWIGTKSFGAKYGQENTTVSHRNYSIINVLSKYAARKTITVKVVDANNVPVKDAVVEYLQYTASHGFYPLAEVPADEFGISRVETGLGDLLIWARKGDDFSFRKICVKDVDRLDLILNRKPADHGSEELDFAIPVARAPLKGPAPELIAANTKRIREEDRIRQASIDSWMKPDDAAHLAKQLGADPEIVKDIISKSMGNYKNIASFLTHTSASDKPLAINLLKQLWDTDLRTITEEILADHLTNVIRFEDTHGAYDHELYSRYVLNPSIIAETIVAWRKYLYESLPVVLRQDAINDPSILITYVNNNIVIVPVDDTYRKISPIGVNELKVADSFSRDNYFVALCRCLGIPSRIEWEVYGYRPQFYFNKEWHDVWFAERSQPVPGEGFIRFSSDEKDPTPEYYTHFTIARFQNGRFERSALTFSKRPRFPDELVAVPAGHYMLVTANRVSDGRILSTFSFFELKQNEHKAIDIKLRRWSRNTTGVDLYIGAWSGDVTNVKRLIQEGSEVDRKDEWGWTALHWAVRGNNKEVVDFLVGEGANVGAKGEKGRTPLHIAAEGGQKELAGLLIAKGADVNAKEDEKGRTPLHIAVISNQKELAEILIARGADVDGKEDEGRTALHKAAEGGLKELAGMLIAKGADVNAQDDGGGTPLNCAIWNDHIDVVKLLLAKGADVNVTGRFGWTALHDTAWLGRLAMAELLIAKGAQVNAQAEKWARTPLDAAISQGHTATAELLRKHGAEEELPQTEAVRE